MSMLEEMLFLLVLFGANVIQGITGFAGTLLAMPASILLIGPDKAKAILNIMAVLSCSIIAVQSLRYVDVRELLKIIAAMLLGMGVGMYAYAVCPLTYLIPVYGAAWAVLLGAGVVHGMFVSGGALLVVYAAATFRDKEVFRSTLAAVWVILNGLLMGKDFFSGVYDGDVVFLTAVSVVPLAAAIYVGTAIHRRINQALFMKLSYALLILSGAMLVL